MTEFSDNADLKATAARRLELLRAVEWESFDNLSVRICPVCKARKNNGHRANCELDKELGR